VGSHSNGTITVTNTETGIGEVIDGPVGEVDNIWGVQVQTLHTEDTPQMIFLPTTNGFF